MDFCAVAIDEGATFGDKNVIFNLENPLSQFKPFPICVLSIDNLKAGGYVKTISTAFLEISKYNIKIGSVICDGSTAQKKAFSYDWEHSLRHIKDASWMKEIIFIPCLCHKLNNAYKQTVIHDDDLNKLVNYIHQLINEARENKDHFPTKCPTFISTRWISDFELTTFILANRTNFYDQDLISHEISDLHQILQIFKTLVTIFDDPTTLFSEAFVFLERARMNFQELIDAGNIFAEKFYRTFLDYTLH